MGDAGVRTEYLQVEAPLLESFGDVGWGYVELAELGGWVWVKCEEPNLWRDMSG
jgi:hypothetical protein